MSSAALLVARRRLSTFVEDRAHASAALLGFSWRPSWFASVSYDALVREFNMAVLSKLPLRVSSLFCARTIFMNPGTNHAMRFWHDTTHVLLGCSFDAFDEMEVGSHHLEVLRAAGFSASSIEHRLLHADTIGQTLCSAELGRFPHDQLRFATTAVRHGVDAAINEVATRLHVSVGDVSRDDLAVALPLRLRVTTDADEAA